MNNSLSKGIEYQCISVKHLISFCYEPYDDIVWKEYLGNKLLNAYFNLKEIKAYGNLFNIDLCFKMYQVLFTFI